MDSLDKARKTQLSNIQNKTGKNLEEIRAMIRTSGLTKHSELRQMFIDKFGLGFGDASSLVHFALQTDGQSAAEANQMDMDEILSGIYTASKAPLRPLHEKVMDQVIKLGEFTIAPKKTYLSLRRKRQFAMLGPGTRGRLEIGLNMKNIPASDRLQAEAPGGMCQYKVFLTTEQEIDNELIGYLKIAYDSAA